VIRLADRPPIYCAACFNQQQDLRHVDFDAASDRGYGESEGLSISMDDIIMCENCVKVGAEQVGMTDDATLKAELAAAKDRADAAEKDAEKQAEYASRLETLFDKRPQPIEIDHRRKPRQRVSV
jgi:hypothetical protein